MHTQRYTQKRARSVHACESDPNVGSFPHPLSLSPSLLSVRPLQGKLHNQPHLQRTRLRRNLPARSARSPEEKERTLSLSPENAVALSRLDSFLKLELEGTGRRARRRQHVEEQTEKREKTPVVCVRVCVCVCVCVSVAISSFAFLNTTVTVSDPTFKPFLPPPPPTPSLHSHTQSHPLSASLQGALSPTRG